MAEQIRWSESERVLAVRTAPCRFGVIRISRSDCSSGTLGGMARIYDL